MVKSVGLWEEGRLQLVTSTAWKWVGGLDCGLKIEILLTFAEILRLANNGNLRIMLKCLVFSLTLARDVSFNDLEEERTRSV